MNGQRETEGSQSDVHLRDYLFVVRKHLGVASAFFVLTVASVAFVTFKEKPVYKASAEIYIEKQTPALAAIRDVYDLGVSPDEYRKTQHQLIRSRQIVSAVVSRNRLEKHAAFADSQDPVEAFREIVSVTPKEGTYLATVSVESHNPAEAADWLNDLLDEYMSYVHLKHKATSSEVQRGLNQEIPRLREKLLDSETKLIDFQRKCNVLSFEKQQEILFKKLEQLDAALTSVQKERVSVEAKLTALESLAGSGGDGARLPLLPEGMENQLFASYRAREMGLVEQLAQCQSRCLPLHPQYVEIGDKLRKLREEWTLEIARIRKSVEDGLIVKKAEEQSLKALVSTHTEEVRKLDDKSNEFKALKSEVDSSRMMYQEFLERRKELESTSGFDATNISVIDRAIPPKSPVRPKKLLNITLAVIVGILGGVALAFFFEYLDDTVKTPEDVRDVMNLPFLGVIPLIPKSDVETTGGVVTRGDSASNISEAFRTVRTGLSFLRAGKGAGAFLVTSPGPEEGKSLNSVNLAVTMAKSSRRVLLVDADLRKPSVHRMLGLGNERGLSTVLAGGGNLDAACADTGIPNLSVLCSGPVPPNPSEMLGSGAMRELVAEMRSKFDFIIFDTPPAGVVTDSVVLSALVDGVIVILLAGHTRKKSAVHCAEQMAGVDAKVVGVVLNSMNISKSSYYRYSCYQSRPCDGAGGGEEPDEI